MDIRKGFIGAIGNTPLIRLNRLSEETGCEILGKAEFLNPGGSVKDRAALYIVQDAEEKGLLKPGGTVVEGTAGNTGIGIAHICLTRGYRCIIYMPNTQSKEKFDMLRLLGAEVRPVPAVPLADPNHYTKQAAACAASLDNAIWANQFDNCANRQGHYVSTGPEIWSQTDGTIDAWVTSIGTGGTFAGVSMFLKDIAPHVKTVVADPMGSVMYSYFTTGKLERSGGSVTEGIGQGRITDNINGAVADDAVQVEDTYCIEILYRLLHEEGLFLGGSSGINVGGAVQLAKKLGPGHTIVTILCDSGARYQSRLYNEEWLKEKNLWEAIPEAYRPVSA